MAKPKSRPTTRPVPRQDGSTQLNMRLPEDLLAGIDALVDDINKGREWPKMTRSDLIRLVMGRTIKERPEWLLKAE